MPEKYVSPWGQKSLQGNKKIETFARYQVTFGFRFEGPHRALVEQLLGDVVESCYACGGHGLAGTYGGMGLLACPLCHGTGSIYTIDLQELERRRQQVLKAYPEAGIPGWQPYKTFNSPGLKLDTGEVIELCPDPQGFEQLELPLGYT